MKTSELYKLYLKHPSVKTDTRKIEKGDIFFALKGPNFNGNTFAAQALKSGAAYAVIDEPEFAVNDKTILVEDALSALQELAKHHRLEFDIPFIAITGSNGKTTSKELVHVVLSSRFKTYTTEGNLNNQIGIPLTILAIKKDAEIAVIEMGANHLKEIQSYCRYTAPTHAVITNCGKAHLEGFGSEEGVRKAKGELFDHIRERGGTAFVMWDYDYLRDMSKGIRSVIKYGTSNADIIGDVLQSDPYLAVTITKGAELPSIETRLVGDYNLPNVLLAVTVGKYFNVPESDIKNSIESYIPSNSRSQLISKDSNKIILDAYNANPTSMKLAIENFSKLHADKKVLILGGMAELGEDSLKEHQALIEHIDDFEWDDVILVGGDFINLNHPFRSFAHTGEAKAWFKNQHFMNTHFLIKGSRSMQMESILF